MAWIEASSLGEWVRSSYLGYPLMIASHAIGMAIMVGLAVALALRVLGWFDEIPYAGLQRFLAIAWAGFALNFISGSGLFTTTATVYITDITFLLKMGFVLGGVVLTAILQGLVSRHGATWQGTVAPVGARVVAISSIACWVLATITGRLIAYV
jgi:hypothetical protein